MQAEEVDYNIHGEVVKIPERALRLVRAPPKAANILNPPAFSELGLMTYNKYGDLNEEFYDNLVLYMQKRGWPKYCSREWLMADIYDLYYSDTGFTRSPTYSMRKPTIGPFWKAMRRRTGEILSFFGYTYFSSGCNRRSLCFVRADDVPEIDEKNPKEIKADEIRAKIKSEC